MKPKPFSVPKLLYNLFLIIYPFAIRLISPFNQKAKQWISGRKNLLQKIKQAIPEGQKTIWMHCSSLGEFEQGRPVIEKLKIQYPAYKIIITFFSPSGYEVRKNYTGADYIFYLPMDGKKNAIAFFDIVRPSLVIYVKYEFWYYYLQEAKNRKVPLLLISAIFRKNQPFFASYGQFHRTMLSCFTHFFVQNEASVALLAGIGFNNVSFSGDTRFDRVVEIANELKTFPEIKGFCGNSDVIIAGSTWTEDDKELDHFANTRKDVKFIIAPHNIVSDRIKECLHLYKNAILFSSLPQKGNAEEKNTLIIDNVGMLSSLYNYATVCYVGGGFGADGVHNVLEAAVYGKPVVFGPEYDKFMEAVELVENGGAVSVSNTLELEHTLDHLLQKNAAYFEKCKAAKQYVYSKQGATERIVAFIYANRLLTT